MLTTVSNIAEQLFGGNDGDASTIRADKTIVSGDETTIFSGDETTIFSGDETTIFSGDETRLSSINDTQTSNDVLRVKSESKVEPPNLLPPPQDDIDLTRQDSLLARLKTDDESAYVTTVYTVEPGKVSDDALSACSGITCDASVATIKTSTCKHAAGDTSVTGTASIATSARTNFVCATNTDVCATNTEEELEHMLREAMAAMLRSYAYYTDSDDNTVITKTDALGNATMQGSYTLSGKDRSKHQSDREDYFLSNPSMESVVSSLFAKIEPAVEGIRSVVEPVTIETKRKVDPAADRYLNPNISSIRHTLADVKEQGLIQVINDTLFGSTEAVTEILDVLDEKGFFKSIARLFSCMDEDTQKRLTQQVIPDLGEIGLLNTIVHLISTSLNDAVDAIASFCLTEKKAVEDTIHQVGPKTVADIIEHNILEEIEIASVGESTLPSQCSSGGLKKSNPSKDVSETAPKESYPSIEITYNSKNKARLVKNEDKVAEKGQKEKDVVHDVSKKSCRKVMLSNVQKRRTHVASYPSIEIIYDQRRNKAREEKERSKGSGT